jgi:hypothetical protein
MNSDFLRKSALDTLSTLSTSSARPGLLRHTSCRPRRIGGGTVRAKRSGTLTLSKTLPHQAVTETIMRIRTEPLLGSGWQAVKPVIAATLASPDALACAQGVI